MPRLNLEESLTKDPRIKKLGRLIGSENLAVGTWIEFAFLAQKFWAKGQLIPEEQFYFLEFPEQLLESKLAERRDEGIYCRGSEEHFGWLKERIDAARTGGRISAQRSRDDHGRLLPKQTPSDHQANAKQNPSEAKPIPITLPINKELILSCASDDALENDNQQVEDVAILQPTESISDMKFVMDDELLEDLYTIYPRKIGRKAGLAKLKKDIKSSQDYANFGEAVENYKDYIARTRTDAKFVKHFSTFVNNWQDWIDPETGTTDSPRRY